MTLPVGMPVHVTRFESNKEINWAECMDDTLNQIGTVENGNYPHEGYTFISVRFSNGLWYYWPKNVHPTARLEDFFP